MSSLTPVSIPGATPALKPTAPILLGINVLVPHPANPRIIEREDVIATIEQQIRTKGFDPSYAILVRPIAESYQIISGHHRTIAARRAEQTSIPAWVREMDDDNAYMQLVLSNTQGELSPLERAIHAYEACKAGKRQDEYAKECGVTKVAVTFWVQAAEVAKASLVNLTELVPYATHLTAIHAAPEFCWPTLVERLLAERWTVEQTAVAVKAVRTIRPPRGYEHFFPVERLQDLAAAGENPPEITGTAVREIERAKSDIRDVQFAVDKHLAEFETWLTETNGAAWDVRAITTKKQDLIDRQRTLRDESIATVAKLKKAVTLPQWNTFTPAEREATLAVKNPNAKLLEQETDSIEWARWSWNR